MRYVVPACAAGALLSLLVLPSAPLHDQWAWIVWGRELVHLDLDASAGPAWKPLPVLVTALLAPFGGATPSLWLAVARFGGLLSLVLGYRLAARFAGWPAGVVAVIALLSAWLRNVSLGIAEGLLVAFGLWAVERHLEGRRGQAFALALAAALIRPEAWPFLGLYGLYLWLTEPRLRVPVAAALLSVPLLWFGPDTFLAGEPLRSSDEAQSAATTVSAGDVLSRAFDVVPVPVHLAALVAVALAIRRRAGPVLALAAGRPRTWSSRSCSPWSVATRGSRASSIRSWAWRRCSPASESGGWPRALLPGPSGARPTAGRRRGLPPSPQGRSSSPRCRWALGG